MKLATLAAAILLLAVGSAPASQAGSSRKTGAALRVCADPNNLPFSNHDAEGFENRLASLIARDLRVTVEYTWWAQHRGFVRNTLNTGDCDVLMGVPTHLKGVETTRAYYRSTYAFVTPRRRHLGLSSLDDPRLPRLRIGVQMIGDDFANSPPAHALSARGMVRNIVGYSVIGDYSQPNPPARIVEAVARGDIDVAVVWGPVAGYFASRQAIPLTVTPLPPDADSPALPFSFDISMAVRSGDSDRRGLLDRFIATHRREIDRLLDQYAVPRTATKGGA